MNPSAQKFPAQVPFKQCRGMFLEFGACIQDYRLSNDVVFPAVAYTAMALEASFQVGSFDGLANSLRDVRIMRVLVFFGQKSRPRPRDNYPS